VPYYYSFLGTIEIYLKHANFKWKVLYGGIFVDLKALKRSEGKFGIEGSPRGDNLFVWVRLSYSCRGLLQQINCLKILTVKNID